MKSRRLHQPIRKRGPATLVLASHAPATSHASDAARRRRNIPAHHPRPLHQTDSGFILFPQRALFRPALRWPSQYSPYLADLDRPTVAQDPPLLRPLLSILTVIPSVVGYLICHSSNLVTREPPCSIAFAETTDSWVSKEQSLCTSTNHAEHHSPSTRESSHSSGSEMGTRGGPMDSIYPKTIKSGCCTTISENTTCWPNNQRDAATISLSTFISSLTFSHPSPTIAFPEITPKVFSPKPPSVFIRRAHLAHTSVVRLRRRQA
jgi:hypothetical protein